MGAHPGRRGAVVVVGMGQAAPRCPVSLRQSGRVAALLGCGERRPLRLAFGLVPHKVS